MKNPENTELYNALYDLFYGERLIVDVISPSAGTYIIQSFKKITRRTIIKWIKHMEDASVIIPPFSPKKNRGFWGNTNSTSYYRSVRQNKRLIERKLDEILAKHS